MNQYDSDRYVGGFDMGYNMGGMGYSNRGCDSCHHAEESIEKTLRRNIGRVVIIFTDDFEFTGLVTKVDHDTVKLITSIPSAPFERARFERCEGNCDFNLDKHCKNSHFGSAVIIPLCKITAVSVVEI